MALDLDLRREAAWQVEFTYSTCSQPQISLFCSALNTQYFEHIRALRAFTLMCTARHPAEKHARFVPRAFAKDAANFFLCVYALP